MGQNTAVLASFHPLSFSFFEMIFLFFFNSPKHFQASQSHMSRPFRLEKISRLFWSNFLKW